jgi:hypothetical protein
MCMFWSGPLRHLNSSRSDVPGACVYDLAVYGGQAYTVDTVGSSDVRAVAVRRWVLTIGAQSHAGAPF